MHGKKDGIVEARQPASQLAISPEKCGPRALGNGHACPLEAPLGMGEQRGTISFYIGQIGTFNFEQDKYI